MRPQCKLTTGKGEEESEERNHLGLEPGLARGGKGEGVYSPFLALKLLCNLAASPLLSGLSFFIHVIRSLDLMFFNSLPALQFDATCNRLTKFFFPKDSMPHYTWKLGKVP